MLDNEVTIEPVVRNYKPRKPKTEEQKQMALSIAFGIINYNISEVKNGSEV
jgi:hypothetical protein